MKNLDKNDMENLDEAHYEEVNSEEAEKLCEENGLRYIGRDPYNNNSHHVARWLDSNCSVTVGHFDSRAEFNDLLVTV